MIKAVIRKSIAISSVVALLASTLCVSANEITDYEVIDNFDGNIEIFTTLNDVIYDGDLVNKPGDYTFKVIAKDSSGNESTKIIEFKIIDNDVISCGDDVECYVDNYLQVVCIVGVLMVLILAMLGWKLIIMVNKKKKRKE